MYADEDADDEAEADNVAKVTVAVVVGARCELVAPSDTGGVWLLVPSSLFTFNVYFEAALCKWDTERGKEWREKNSTVRSGQERERASVP